MLGVPTGAVMWADGAAHPQMDSAVFMPDLHGCGPKRQTAADLFEHSRYAFRDFYFAEMIIM